MTCTENAHPSWRAWTRLLLLCAVLSLGACGVGVEEAGGSSGEPNGGEPNGGEPTGDPGAGGGPGAPGGTGNPLQVVLDFSVQNDASVARTETIRASVPFPRGGYSVADLDNMVVSGHQTAWMPMQFWPDGKVKVAQAQFTDELAAGESKSYVVARDEAALTGAFERNPWVSQFGGLSFGAEVRDTYQVPYRSFATGAGELLQTSALTETRRYRTYHEAVAGPGAGIGRDYLTSTYYVTEFRDMPYVYVDWVLGNDYLGADDPGGSADPNLYALGDADLRAAYFLCKGASQCMPYRAASEGISGATTLGDYNGFKVMQDTYLTDGQTRRYRFLLRFEPSGAAQADKDRWRDTADAVLQQPMYALASHSAFEETAAAGLLGGPLEGPADSASRAASEFGSWNNSNFFGTFGSRGDAKPSATTGTPRNHPLSPELAHAIQGQHHRLLEKLEQKAWIQSVRPYHLYGLEVGAEQPILLYGGLPFLVIAGEHLGRKTLRDNDPYPGYRQLSNNQPHAHGWSGYDHEHFSADLLFDYWTMSGDAWAKEELRQLGQSAKGLLRLNYSVMQNVQPTRAEGWVMQAFAQVYQATQDEALKDYAMRRVNEVVEPGRRKEHPSKAMRFQTNYAGTGYPLNHEFVMPWQHGAVLYGYLGAYLSFEEPALLTICEDVPTTVEYSWVTNMNHPSHGQVANGMRYYLPISHNGTLVPPEYWDNLPNGPNLGSNPLGSAHIILVGGLHLLADITQDPTVRSKALYYGGMLRGTVDPNDRWNKWWYCLPPGHAQ
jgi:hypothetical protein